MYKYSGLIHLYAFSIETQFGKKNSKYKYCSFLLGLNKILFFYKRYLIIKIDEDIK